MRRYFSGAAVECKEAPPCEANDPQCRVVYLARCCRYPLGHPHVTQVSAREEDELHPQ